MIDHYRTSFKYCRQCGGPLNEVQNSPVRLRCSRCLETTYLNAKVGVALLIEHDGRVLLARRRDDPYKNWWVLPSGYVEYEESSEDAAVREAAEELSTKVELQGVHGVYSYGDDPRSRMILIVYRATCDPETISAADDVSECRFFPEDRLPKRIAFQGIVNALMEWTSAR